MKQLSDLAEAQKLALAIVDTLPEPFLVLDDTLHLLAASRAFTKYMARTRQESEAAHSWSYLKGNGTFPVCASCCWP